MPNHKEEALNKKGLRNIESLDEIVDAKVFFVDSAGIGDEVMAYPVIPKRGKLNLTHDLLNLYGVHWRYLINISNWDNIRKGKGDTHLVMDELMGGKKSYRHAAFAFTKRYLDSQRSLWLFVPDTSGWDYYQDRLIPRFQFDQREYQTMKRNAHKIGESVRT